MKTIGKQLSIELWISSLLIAVLATYLTNGLLAINVDAYKELISKSIVALAICIVLTKISSLASKIIPYLLFFLITGTSFLGLSKTLTGSYSESSYTALYGFSFYTASLAYATKKGLLADSSSYVVSNPLLLVTGPVATTFKSIDYLSAKKRLDYYLPFILLGAFLHQIIATPLTPLFSLIEKTDIASSIVFAIIFEVFVYSNFAGLSLIIFGIMGIIGIQIPLNFRQPFTSSNMVEFWRGWHTSFSAVLKELFFGPVKKVLGTNAAILMVFVSSALWHGVSLNFLLWGIFHAICFGGTVFMLKKGILIIPTMVQIFGIVIARMISADSNSSRLYEKLRFGFTGFDIFKDLLSMGSHTKLALVLGLTFIFAEMAFKRSKHFRSRKYKFYRLPWVQFFLLLVLLTFVATNSGINYAVYGQR